MASAGLALAAVMLLAIGGAAWWASDATADARRRAREQELTRAAELIGRASEAMLGANDLSGTRRLISESARQFQFESCRIVLSDGFILADSNPSNITSHSLPEDGGAWGALLPDDVQSQGRVEHVSPGQYQRSVYVPSRGLAQLELEDAEVSTSIVDAASSSRILAGVGAIGALGFGALLFIYRRLRKRLRILGAIRESLVLIRKGEHDPSVLRISTALGEDAAAWNTLLNEREEARATALDQRATDSGERRRGSSGELASAWDVMWQGMLLVDENLSVRYANGAAGIFLGKKREEIVGGAISEVFTDPGVVEAITQLAQGEVRRRSVIEVEQSGDHRSGVLRVHMRPVRKEDGASAMVVIEDITQQRVADAARNAFVAQATHELRTPLTNIRLYVESALDEGETDAALRSKALNVINQEARRLERIVGDMLSVSEIEAGSLSIHEDEVRLDALMEDLLRDYQVQAEEKQLSLRFELPPKLPVIRGDRDKITLALHNLLGNALKYTPSGGDVALQVKVDVDRVTFDIIDSGLGIAPDDQEKIFDKFYRARDERISDVTGSGLGLALARDVVRLHGGDITLESEVDKGSTFSMWLPAHVEAA